MTAPHHLSTSIPPHLLKTAYLVGKVPFRACKLDPRVSYGLYIPETAYVAYQTSLQAGHDVSALRLPLVVNVHGTKHDASPHRDILVSFADTHGVAILAPFFPAALDHPLDLDSYKLLRSATLQSDRVLLSIVEEIGHIWPGIKTDRFALMGFSGGGQFSHRFLYLHPKRISAAIVGAPGRTTLLTGQPWPAGIGNVAEIFDGHSVDINAIRQIRPILLIVGDADNDMTSILELKTWFAKQGPTSTGLKMSSPRSVGDWERGRVAELQALHAHWLEHGIQNELVLVPGAQHNHLRVMPAILKWLEDNIESIR